MDSLNSNAETATQLDESNINADYSGRDNSGIRDTSLTSNGSPRNLSYTEANKEKFISSHKELQEAKKKLEELRLLRFEEKSSLKQEIEQLSEKYGEEERNSSNLERQLKKYSADKIALDKKLSDLEREQSIGVQINMMQEQEIVRLEMKLKDEELQRYDVSRQLDLLRKTILEKDQLRMQQQNEVFVLKEGIAQLDESNCYYKSTVDDSQQKILEIEDINHSLNEELSVLKTQLQEARSEIAKVCVELKNAQMKIGEMEETAANTLKELMECQVNLESQITRSETMEDERRKQEIILQEEIEKATFNENKYKDKCEQTERLFHETRREKDEQIFNLQRVADRVPTLEEQIESLEAQNCESELLLNELRDVVARHIRKQHDDKESDLEPELTQLSPLKSPGKQVSPCKSSSPVKRQVVDDVTPEEVGEYFKETYSSMNSLQEKISTLSEQVEQKQTTNTDLSTTVGELRGELERAQSTIASNAKVTVTIQEQYLQANETIQLQERNNERKTKENEHLRELVQDCEGQINRLKTELESANAEMQQNSETHGKHLHGKEKEMDLLRETIQDFERQVDVLKIDISSLNSEISQNTASHKEEESRLQGIIQELETNIETGQGEKKDEQAKFEEESNTLKEVIENRNKEIRDLKSELENLIEDNKNLAQRLMHLESYSDKLSDMLDKNQTADDKAREKFANEIKEYKQMVADKDAEANELTRKLGELNESVRVKSEEMDKTLNGLASSQKKIEEDAGQARKDKENMEAKMKSAADAHLAAEKTLAENTEENLTLEKRCSEQLKLMEELHERINLLENENAALKQTVKTMERGVRLKESLIAELSRKAGESSESFKDLKSNILKTESEKRHYENKLNIFRHEKQILEKNIREHEDEKTYLRDQVGNLQRLLAKAEDDKEVSLGNMAHYQSQVETLQAIKDKTTLKDLEGQVKSLRVELNLERQRRERLESRYMKRDDQVSQLRSTFDQSLNTISKDTKNIKSIIGKSLQKIDRIENNEVTDSDLLDTDSESLAVKDSNNNTKVNVNSKYLSLPTHRSKSVENTLEGLKGNTPYTSSSTPRRSKHGDTKSTSTSAPKSITTLSSPTKVLSYTPVRDEVPSYRKNKRMSR